MDDLRRKLKIKPHEEEDNFDFREYQLQSEKEESEELERQKKEDAEDDARFERELYRDIPELTEDELLELNPQQGVEDAETKGK